MRIDVTKATLGGAWLIGLSAIALSDLTASGSNRALILGSGFVLVALMWWLWTPRELALSESVAKGRE